MWRDAFCAQRWHGGTRTREVEEASAEEAIGGDAATVGGGIVIAIAGGDMVIAIAGGDTVIAMVGGGIGIPIVVGDMFIGDIAVGGDAAAGGCDCFSEGRDDAERMMSSFYSVKRAARELVADGWR